MSKFYSTYGMLYKDKIPQYHRCESCIYNIEGICDNSPTKDNIQEYLAECDRYSNCGRNRRK